MTPEECADWMAGQADDYSRWPYHDDTIARLAALERENTVLKARDSDAEYIIGVEQAKVAALEGENARLAELVRELGGQP